MSVQPKTRYSLDEYLALERSEQTRHEFLDGEVFAMGGASWAHVLIVGNLSHHLRNEIAGRGCRVVTNDLCVKVSRTGLYTYPDVAVVCGSPALEQPGETLLNPKAIIEVLSESTEAYDRGRKFEHYRAIESLTDYLLVSQDQVLVEHYSRQSDGRWLYIACNLPDRELTITSLDCTLSMTEVYEGVENLASPIGNQ